MASPPPTTSISLQPQPHALLQTINLHLPALSTLQSPTIPLTLKHSLTVRESVFVNEQRAVPLQHHIDRDDGRSYHWILYTSTTSNFTSSPETREGEKVPIGTIRLVPPPHYPHPDPGVRFEAPGSEVPALDPKVLFSQPLPEYRVDRRTDLHDGVETYIKLGRLSVVREYRGHKLADLLIQEALGWASKRENWYAAGGGEKEWRGLVCVHAQEGAVGVWSRNAFVVDEGMGSWFEGGIRHVGMFRRLEMEG